MRLFEILKLVKLPEHCFLADADDDSNIRSYQQLLLLQYDDKDQVLNSFVVAVTPMLKMEKKDAHCAYDAYVKIFYKLCD